VYNLNNTIGLTDPKQRPTHGHNFLYTYGDLRQLPNNQKAKPCSYHS